MVTDLFSSSLIAFLILILLVLLIALGAVFGFWIRKQRRREKARITRLEQAILRAMTEIGSVDQEHQLPSYIENISFADRPPREFLESMIRISGKLYQGKLGKLKDFQELKDSFQQALTEIRNYQQRVASGIPPEKEFAPYQEAELKRVTALIARLENTCLAIHELRVPDIQVLLGDLYLTIYEYAFQLKHMNEKLLQYEVFFPFDTQEEIRRDLIFKTIKTGQRDQVAGVLGEASRDPILKERVKKWVSLMLREGS